MAQETEPVGKTSQSELPPQYIKGGHREILISPEGQTLKEKIHQF
ncbi:hypothetical protein [Lacticaseibacillus paracasei]|jgi:hypothetical protein|nr:hypothetical protein [Lacticaseibacillus paracasei]